MQQIINNFSRQYYEMRNEFLKSVRENPFEFLGKLIPYIDEPELLELFESSVSPIITDTEFLKRNSSMKNMIAKKLVGTGFANSCLNDMECEWSYTLFRMRNEMECLSVTMSFDKEKTIVERYEEIAIKIYKEFVDGLPRVITKNEGLIKSLETVKSIYIKDKETAKTV